MTQTTLDLYPSQGRLIRARGREVLVTGPERSGISHALRITAILRAAQEASTFVVIACRDAQAVREDHVEGPTGLWEMFLESAENRAVQFKKSNTVGFPNRSTLSVTTWSAAARLYPTTLLIDDADELDFSLFCALRERVLGVHPGNSNGPRLYLVSRSPEANWAARHWATLNGTGERVSFSAGELPPQLAEAGGGSRRRRESVPELAAAHALPPYLPHQATAAAVPARELLVRKEPCSGASFLLRRMAVERAAAGASVLLVSPDDAALRVDHLEDHGRPTSLWRMVQDESCRLLPGEVRWSRLGGSLRISTWDSAPRRLSSPVDAIYVDEADDMPYALFQRLRDRAMQAPAATGPAGEVPRLIATAARPGEGWVGEHFGLRAGPGMAAVDLRTEDLPAALRIEEAIVERPQQFADFFFSLLPRIGRWPHLLQMLDAAQRVIDGEVRRLLVMAPPRTYKSLVFSRVLPAYFLKLRPAEWVGLLSAAGDLPELFSSDARELYQAAGGTFRLDSQNKSLWRTPKGGGLWARGLGAKQLGLGFSLGVIDDVFGSYEEAQSEAQQIAAENGVYDTFIKRRDLTGENPAAVIAVMQRLAYRDLGGRIIAREQDPEKRSTIPWTVLDLPARARRRRVSLPPSMTVIEPRGADGRQLAEGELLCPELLPAAELEEDERNNSIMSAAVNQQEPLEDAGGGMFKAWWWRLKADRKLIVSALEAGVSLSDLIRGLVAVGVIPPLVREARGWDFAATLDGGDATASTRGGVTVASEIIWTDATEAHVGPESVEDLIYETALADGPHVDVVLPAEPAAAGKILVHRIQARLKVVGIYCVIVPMAPEGRPLSKRMRAQPHAGAARCIEEGPNAGKFGRCWCLDGPWRPMFTLQHQGFDGAQKPMDVVDAASVTFSELDSGSRMGSTIGAS